MPEFIASPPWYIPSALGVIALVLLFQGNRSTNKQLKSIGLLCAVLATVVMALGHFLESDREAVERRTRELAAAVDRRDWKTFGEMLDPKVSFEKFYVGKDSLVAGAEATVDKVGVKDITISGVETAFRANAYDVTFRATAEIREIGQRAPTDWRLTWAKDPKTDQFVLLDVRFIPNAQYGDAVTSRLAKTK